MKRYFFSDFENVPSCTLRVSGKSVLCESGYANLDPVEHGVIISTYKGIEAPEPAKTVKKVKEGEE